MVEGAAGGKGGKLKTVGEGDGIVGYGLCVGMRGCAGRWRRKGIGEAARVVGRGV